MFMLLPALSLVMVFFSTAAPRRDWRARVLVTAVIGGSLVVAITEGLSLVNGLTRDGVALAWAGVLVAALVSAWRRRLLRAPVTMRSAITAWRAMPSLTRAWWSASLLLILLTGGAALLKPSTNFDSMTYHLSRCVHWMQNQDTAHYPTHNLRQLYLNPWSEFAITHTMLLSGGDRYASVLQWLSMIGSLIAVTLITDQWRVGHAADTSARSRALAVLIAVTVPAGIVQAASTQNNHAVTFWILCAVYGIQRSHQASRLRLDDAALIGASAGLAVLTKGIAYVYLAPFVVWLAVTWLRRTRLRALVIPALGMVGLVLLLNAGHWWRNLVLFDHPLGPTAASSPDHHLGLYRNMVWGPAPLASNLIRNAALHAGTPFPATNTTLTEAIAGLHDRVLGLDPSDPRTTWTGTTFKVPDLSTNEDSIGSPLHLVLVVWALGWITLNAHRRKLPRGLAAYALAVFVAVVLFSGLFKWQPWHSRLHLPFFLLGAPLAGHALARVRARCLVNAMSIALIAAAGLFSAATYKTIVRVHDQPRSMQHFASSPNLAPPFQHAVDLLAQAECATIGLYQSSDAWEYPWWPLLNDAGVKPVEIRHVKVSNVSRRTSTASFDPCAVIVSDRAVAHELHVKETEFALAGQWDLVSVWRPVPEHAAPR